MMMIMHIHNLLTFLHFVQIKGTKSQGCSYCDKCKLVNIWKDENINQFLLANYQNGRHFDFLKIKTNTLKPCLIPSGNFFERYKISKKF